MQKSLVPEGYDFLDFSQCERTLEERINEIKLEPGLLKPKQSKQERSYVKTNLPVYLR